MRIKSISKVDGVQEIVRWCSICGEEIAVSVFADGKYVGGNYFGKIAAKNFKKSEYWECDRCYRED